MTSYRAAKFKHFVMFHVVKLYVFLQVIARIVDASEFQEFKEKFGTGLVTGFAFIKGSVIPLKHLY